MTETPAQRARAQRPGIVPLRKLIRDVAATPDRDDYDDLGTVVDDVTAERIAAAVLDHLAPLTDPAAARAYLDDTARLSTYHRDWCHGPDRGMWRGGHAVQAGDGPDFDGHAVIIDRGWGIARDELPSFIAFLTAVHAVSDPALVEGGESS